MFFTPSMTAIVARIPAGWRVKPRHAFLAFEWTGDFESIEMLEFDERAVIAELCQFASSARQVPDFLEKVPDAVYGAFEAEALFPPTCQRGMVVSGSHISFRLIMQLEHPPA